MFKGSSPSIRVIFEGRINPSLNGVPFYRRLLLGGGELTYVAVDAAGFMGRRRAKKVDRECHAALTVNWVVANGDCKKRVSFFFARPIDGPFPPRNNNWPASHDSLSLGGKESDCFCGGRSMLLTPIIILIIPVLSVCVFPCIHPSALQFFVPGEIAHFFCLFQVSALGNFTFSLKLRFNFRRFRPNNCVCENPIYSPPTPSPLKPACD